MKSEVILITGANGEVGHGLIKKLIAKSLRIIALDIDNLDKNLSPSVSYFYKGSVLNKNLLEKIFGENKITTTFHLAAVLSTSGEKKPEIAHDINVNGTFNLLSYTNRVAQKEKRVIEFIFPSSIAVYGLPGLSAKVGSSFRRKIKEPEFLNPITMYGINKLYCENLGIYYSSYFGSLFTNHPSPNIDFRCLRFPGLISADTTPSGGTSDYGPEMLHAAAQNRPYKCFVRANSTIPFMAMPDAVRALILLADAPQKKLTQDVYNIRGFSASAADIEGVVKKHFPQAKISYQVDQKRQKIVDSWGEDVDDSKAHKDWGWRPKYNFRKAFEDYLIPAIIKKYKS